MGSTVTISYLENKGATGNVTVWVERAEGHPEARRVFLMEAGERVEVKAIYSFPISPHTMVIFKGRATQPDDTDLVGERVHLEVVRLPGFPRYPTPIPTPTPRPTPTPTPPPPTPTPTPTPEPLASGETVTGNIDSWRDTDRWSFHGNEGYRVTIRMEKGDRGDLAPYVELIAPDGSIEFFAWDDRRQGFALIDNWQLRHSGTYVIVARCLYLTSGPYTLSLTVLAAVPGE